VRCGFLHEYPFFSFLIIRTFIKEKKKKKLRNNLRKIDPANISITSTEVILITGKGPSKTTSQLNRSMSYTITVSTNPTKSTTQKFLLISKLFLIKVEMDQCTCFPFELIATSESIQIFASPSTIIRSLFSTIIRSHEYPNWLLLCIFLTSLIFLPFLVLYSIELKIT